MRGERADESLVDRGRKGTKGSTVVNARGIPLGTIAVPASRHDSPILTEPLDTWEALGPLLERTSMHLDRGYDSEAALPEKGRPAPVVKSKR